VVLIVSLTGVGLVKFPFGLLSLGVESECVYCRKRLSLGG
jgi:hypothetical protein